MIKRIFSLLFVAVACSTAALAQTSLVATLKHGGAISEYYGGDALVNAYSFAQAGDVITLSSGTFKAVDIAKAITVCGAGMDETILDGDFSITGSGTYRTTLEGCECLNTVKVLGRDMEIGIDDILLMKSFFHGLDFKGGTINVIQCLVQELSSLNIDNDGINTSVSCYNSVLWAREYASHIKTFYLFQNCLLNGYGFSWHFLNSKMVNSIFGWDIDGSNTVEYCAIRNFTDFPNSNNVGIYSDYLAYLKLAPNSPYELTEEAKAICIGSDGKEMGIYGGNMPYDPTPTNPQIKKFNVSTSNTDGKLNVKINVE